MKVNLHLFILSVFVTLCLSPAYAVELAGIDNPGNWQQQTRTETYTVAANGQTLLYRNKDTGMTLQSQTTPGSKIQVTDENIAPKPASGVAAKAKAGSMQGNNATTTGNAGTAPSAAPAGSTTTAANTPQNQPKAGGVKQTAATVGKVAGAAVGTAVGGYMIYDATKGQEKHSVGNMLEGVAGGAMAGAAIGSVVPVVGTGIGTAIGAVVGGAIAGSQLFSETDCLTDPVTNQFTCCNTVFNKGERLAKIGDYMFCASEDGKTNFIGGVRQCLQGESETKLSWWEGLWKDDHWTPKCVTRYCDDEVQPASGLDAFIDPDPDMVNFCWRWKCKDGLARSGDKCLTADGSLPVDQYDVVINKIQQERQRLIGICGNM